MMKKDAKIYVAGHRGMVGSAIVRELKKQGYITIAGRVNRSYFYERIYRAEKGEAYAGIPK